MTLRLPELSRFDDPKLVLIDHALAFGTQSGSTKLFFSEAKSFQSTIHINCQHCRVVVRYAQEPSELFRRHVCLSDHAMPFHSSNGTRDSRNRIGIVGAFNRPDNSQRERRQ